jgi:hypothetical protein
VGVPVLQITASRDDNATNADHGDPIWQALPGTGHLRVNFDTGGHFTATNFCDLGAFIGLSELVPDCGEDYIEPAVAHEAINAYAHAFVRYHLWGDTTVEDILDGTTQLASPVTVTRK